MINMQLHKNQHSNGAPPQSTSQHIISQLQMMHHNPHMPSPQQIVKHHHNQGTVVVQSYEDDNIGNRITSIQQQHHAPSKKKQTTSYPIEPGAIAPHDGSGAGISIKMTSTMGNASDSLDEVSAISAFHVAQMNVIGGGDNGDDGTGQSLKKGATKIKGNGGSIIVVDRQDQQVLLPQKTVKKTTASQNKFDIKAIIESAQDGAPSRKTQSHDHRSHPSNNSAAPIIGNGNSLLISQNTHQHHQHPLISQQQQDRRGVAATNGGGGVQVLHQNQINTNVGAPQGNLFASFFSQPKEQYEFLTKTLGCTPAQNINQNQSIMKAPSTSKQTQKKGSQLLQGDSVNATISVIKKDSITNLKQQQNDLFVQKQPSNSKINNNNKKTLVGGPPQNQAIIYKSFQQSPAVASLQQKSTLKEGGQQPQQQFLNNTLQTFTQNYYGAQHKKKQTLQKKVGATTTTQQQMQQHRRDHSEIQTLKSSFTQLHQQPSTVPQPQGNSSSRQMRFGQIMEELERYSISNHQQQHASGEIAMHDLIGEEGWAVDSNGGTTTIAQSSICESDLEYTQLGNIRASTYKRTVENQEARKRLMKYKSEERKREPSFFTKEYMDNRYVNDRVEMELKDFKAEIEKKYEGSKLRDFKYPRIVILKPAAASTTRPNRQIKALAPNQHPHLYQNQSRGHSVEDEGYSWNNSNMAGGGGGQRITLGGKNVIFKTTSQQQNHAKPSSSQVKNKNISILDEFPVEIIKTHDMRPQQNDLLPTTTINNGGTKQHVGDLQSFNESMTDINIMGGGQQHLVTQDSIHYYENSKQLKKQGHQHSNSQGTKKTNAAGNQMNVLLQNFFVKQNPDNQTSTKQPLNPHLQSNMTHSTTTKKSSKMVNNSQDTIMAHHFNTFDAHEQSRTKGNQTVLLQKMNNEKQQSQKDSKNNQQKGAPIQQQKQTPKNYSLQLNQVVKKILNDSGEGQQQPANGMGENHQQMKTGLNSTSFDNHQMLYEPSFYTTESYNNKNPKKQMSNDRSQLYNSNNLMVVGGVSSGKVPGEEEHDPMMIQTYTSVSDQKRTSGALGAVSTKKSLKVKRSDSNGSNGQQKNTLLNKIYRSSKTIKSPQSRQSNMNLNNQNGINNNGLVPLGGRGGDMLRIAKPSQTVNQSNVNSTMSSVRQLHILQKQAPISHSRQGSSGMRQQQHQAKSTGKTQTSRLPSSTKKGHQHNLSHVPSSQQHPLLVSNMFQTDTGASFHNYPNQNSNRNNHTANSKDKRTGQQQQILIKNSQIKRTSGERSNREAKEKGTQQHKIQYDSSQQQQFAMLQKTFHNQPVPQSQSTVNQNPMQNFMVQKQDMQIASTGMKGSVASSPNQKQHKKSQSLTSKNTQRSVGQSQGKLVNLGILGQISNPQTNGKGGKITYRNNYPRINTNSNGLIEVNEMNNRLVSHVSTGVTSSLLMGGSNIPIQIGNCVVPNSNNGAISGPLKNNTALSKNIHYPQRMPSQGNVTSGYDQYQSIDMMQSKKVVGAAGDSSKVKKFVSITSQL